MSDVTLTNVIKKYGQTQVVHGVDLSVEPGEFCVFVGPSGCGKSTLLRMIAGLEETTAGSIQIAGRDVTHADPAKRGVAMVFQTYALYPHMTVAENMSFGLRMGGTPKPEIAQKVAEAAGILKLEPYLDRKQRRFPVVSDRGSRLDVPSCAGRMCFCLMSRCRTLTLNCGSKCGSNWHGCTRKSAQP